MLRRFEELAINPLTMVSGALMILSPFMSWMTLSAFGYVKESTLWQITQSQTNFPIGRYLPSAALVSAVLVWIAGLLMLKSAKLGLSFSTVALVIFGYESYSSFGLFSGVIPVSILPGIGVFLALCGIVLGLVTLRTAELPAVHILAQLRTRTGLGQTGILLASFFLATDAWSHWSTGGLSDFLGVTLLEGLIHRVFFLGVAVLLMIFVVRRDLFLERTGEWLVLATLAAMIADAAYHFTTGSFADFVGHNFSEIIYHALTYYGMVSLVAARFVLRR